MTACEEHVCLFQFTLNVQLKYDPTNSLTSQVVPSQHSDVVRIDGALRQVGSLPDVRVGYQQLTSQLRAHNDSFTLHVLNACNATVHSNQVLSNHQHGVHALTMLKFLGNLL